MICTIANGCAMRSVRSKMRWRFRHRIAAMRGVPKGDDGALQMDVSIRSRQRESVLFYAILFVKAR